MTDEDPIYHDTNPRLMTKLGEVEVETEGGPLEGSVEDIAERHRKEVERAVEKADHLNRPRGLD